MRARDSIIKFIGLCVVSGISGPAVAEPAAEDGYTVTVEVQKIEGSPAVLRVALFASDDEFPMGTPVYAETRTVTESSGGDIVIAGVKAGKYALVVHHDQDGDGDVDTNLFGMPTEGVGFGNSAPVRAFGPPLFDNAAIEVAGDMRTQVSIRY